MSVGRAYQPAKRCTTGPQPGAKNLMSYVLGAWGPKGVTNGGIYNCRKVRGSTSTTSLHGEGRACDFMLGQGDPDGDLLAAWLYQNSAELGVQCVIYERRIWSGARPDEGWRPYGGTNPHTDHIHVELTWDGARDLTVARCNALANKRVVGTAKATPAPQSKVTPIQEEDDMLRVIRTSGTAAQYVTDGLTRRWITSPGDSVAMQNLGLLPKGYSVVDTTREVIEFFPLVGPEAPKNAR